MTDTQSPDQTDDDSPIVGAARSVAIAATLCFVVIVLSSLWVWNASGNSPHALVPVLVLIGTTPIFFVFVLPALLLSFLGGPTSAKVSLALVLGGLVIGIVAVVPILR